MSATDYLFGNFSSILDRKAHAQSFKLRIAVLSLLKEIDASVFNDAYYWACYFRCHGALTYAKAAAKGVEQVTL